MVMPATSTYWTAEMVRALPDDGNRYECIDGELLVSPAPRSPHQAIVGELHYQLRRKLEGTRTVRVLASPADLELEPGTIVQPDLFVFPVAEGRGLPMWNEISTLLLAIEVLSSSTASNDRVKKRQFFARVGVPEYWVIDPVREVAEVAVLGSMPLRVESAQLTWQPPGDAANVVIDLPALFAAAR
jgi:Uma2 family endonuclease